jgi:hypothetical protein
MTGNTVEITIKGDPSHFNKAWKSAQGLLNNSRSSWGQTGEGLGNSTGQGFAKGFQVMGLGKLASGAFLGSIGANIATSLFGASLAAVGTLKDNLQDAMKIDTSNLNVASDFSQTFAIDFKTAKNINESVQADLAAKAAPLPGSTEDYTAVYSQIASTVAKLTGKDDFRSTIVDLSSRVGALAAISGADASMGGNALNRAISGTTGLGELMQIDLFQKSAGFTGAIRDGLAQMGKSTKDWQQLTSQDRLGVLSKALKVAISDDKLANFEGSAEAIVQGFQTSLFSPQVGLFGVLRRVSSAGGKTTLEAFTGVLTQLGSLSGSFGKLASRLGLSFDPMAMVISGLDTFKGWLGSLDRFLGSIRASGLSGIFSGLTDSLKNIDSKGLASGLSGVLKGAIGSIGVALAATDWRSVGASLAMVTGKTLETLGYLITDPGLWGEAIATLGQAILGSAKLLGAMSDSAMGALATGVSNQFQQIFEGIRGLTQGLVSKIGEVLGVLSSLWDGLLAKIQGFASGILSTPSPGSPIGSVVGSVARSSLGTAATSISPLATAMVQKAAQVFSPTINSAVSVQAQTNADPDSIGRAASAHIGSEYRKYAQGSLK